MAFVEPPRFCVDDLDDPDQFPLGNQRHAEDGTGLNTCGCIHSLEVTLIRSCVRDDQRFPVMGYPPGQALLWRQTPSAQGLCTNPGGLPAHQVPVLRINEPDRAPHDVDQAAQLFQDRYKDLIQIQARIQRTTCQVKEFQFPVTPYQCLLGLFLLRYIVKDDDSTGSIPFNRERLQGQEAMVQSDRVFLCDDLSISEGIRIKTRECLMGVFRKQLYKG